MRGKSKSPTEFGAKIGASIVQGYTFVDHHCWDAYNESSDLSLQIKLYLEPFGFLPAKIYADKIYMNKGNRTLTKEYQAEMAKAVGERNEIEATFGTGKRIYRMNQNLIYVSTIWITVTARSGREMYHKGCSNISARACWHLSKGLLTAQ